MKPGQVESLFSSVELEMDSESRSSVVLCLWHYEKQSTVFSLSWHHAIGNKMYDGHNDLICLLCLWWGNVWILCLLVHTHINLIPSAAPTVSVCSKCHTFLFCCLPICAFAMKLKHWYVILVIVCSLIWVEWDFGTLAGCELIIMWLGRDKIKVTGRRLGWS